MALATITESGRAFMAAAIKAKPLHIAWGSGLEEWDSMLDGDLPSFIKRTELFTEVGRRTPATVGFVTPDNNGGVVVPMGVDSSGNVIYRRYAQVENPTPYLYVRCNFDNADAQNVVIREMALFGDSTTKADLPPGQQYFLPHEVINQGFMIAAEIVRPSLLRSPNVRESYEFVLPL